MPKKKPTEKDRPTFTPSGTTVATDDHWDSTTIQTGIPPLDHILGSGFGCRRLAELYGVTSSGKSAVGYGMLVRAEKMGGVGILVDNEGAFNKEYYQYLGGDANKLHIADEFSTDTIESVFEFMKDNFERYGELGLDAPPMVLVWDSIAATGTKHLQETDLGTKDMSKSTSMSAGLQKILPYIRSANVCAVFINQLYANIGKYGPLYRDWETDRKSTRLNSSHSAKSRMPSSA